MVQHWAKPELTSWALRKDFNARTADQAGMIIPVVITVYEDRSFDFVTKTPPAPVLLKKVTVEHGSGEPNTKKVAKVTKDQVKQIAETKMQDLNVIDVEAPMRMVEGTARSMGFNCRRLIPATNTTDTLLKQMYQVGRPSRYNHICKEEFTRWLIKEVKYQDAVKQVEAEKNYTLDEAVDLVKKIDFAKFDATVEIAFKLNVDIKEADQQLRGAVVLPNGTGKDQTVIVFAKGDKAKEAQAAGADFVGEDDLVAKIQDGWLDFDVAIATPDMMAQVGRLGRVLGPKGLMPNPKTGTVTMDVTKAVNDSKAGKVTYRTDRDGNVAVPVGKVSFDADKLVENLKTIANVVVSACP